MGLARNKRACRQRSTPRPSLEGLYAGMNEPVSWLETASLSFPTLARQWTNEEAWSAFRTTFGARSLLQWRGRTGFAPVSNSVARSCLRLFWNTNLDAASRKPAVSSPCVSHVLP
jgi:hypothetical protein